MSGEFPTPPPASEGAGNQPAETSSDTSSTPEAAKKKTGDKSHTAKQAGQSAIRSILGEGEAVLPKGLLEGDTSEVAHPKDAKKAEKGEAASDATGDSGEPSSQPKAEGVESSAPTPAPASTEKPVATPTEVRTETSAEQTGGSTEPTTETTEPAPKEPDTTEEVAPPKATEKKQSTPPRPPAEKPAVEDSRIAAEAAREYAEDTTDIVEFETGDSTTATENNADSFGPVSQLNNPERHTEGDYLHHDGEGEAIKTPEAHSDKQGERQQRRTPERREAADETTETITDAETDMVVTPEMLAKIIQHEIKENARRQKEFEQVMLKAAEDLKKKNKKTDKVEKDTTDKELDDTDPAEAVDTLTDEEKAQRLALAEEARYKASLKEKSETAPDDPDALKEAVSEYSKERPLKEHLIHLGVSMEEYQGYLFSLSESEIAEFTELTSAEQQQRIKEAADERRTEKAAEVAALKAAAEKLPSTQPEAAVKAFIDSLNPSETAFFMNLPDAVRDRMIQEWNGKRSKDLLRATKQFFERLSEGQYEKFMGLSADEQLGVLQLWRDGGFPPGFDIREQYTHSDKEGKQRLQAPSYRIFDTFEDEYGESYREIITEHKLRTQALSKEEIKDLVRFRDRIFARVVSKWYNAKLLVFQYEKTIAEENKHMQEYIRGIVDTGPDENIRLVFAQKHGNVWLDYNGNEVSEGVVRRAQKRALAHPSLFQAYCHYELSKREEPEQMKLWEEIFEMMAHHHYDRYSMFGVVVGLQFMNKPSYLAFKNARIEWMPEYEKDSHGHVVNDDEGNPKKLRYTEETIWEYRNGIKRRKRDPDGLPVKIGDIVRSNQRARFATIDLELSPSDQEYNEKNPDGSDKYEVKYRTIRDAEGNELYKEAYKSKKILELKRVSFAHEIGGKFMSYQYGFRSADVAVTLDEARHAYATALRCARSGRFHSREFQEAAYLLSRLKMIVDTSRLGGAASGDGQDAGGEESAMRSAQMDAAIRQNYDAALRKALADGATQEEAEARASKLLESVRAGGGYPPRISGTAEANVLFLELAVVVDKAALNFPHITKIRKSDYEAIQQEYKPSSH